MKKLALCAAVAMSVATSVKAQEAPEYENWVGVFGQYYNADSEKHEPIGGLEDGKGYGGEMGFRFDPAWAIRFELARVMIDHDPNNPNALSDDGTQLGADMMYFLEDDAAYLFAGLKEQSLLVNSYRMANLGIGKHWKMSESIRVITELAAYHDFGQGYNEFSAKLGLAYVYGMNKTVSNPDSDGDGVYDAVDRCPNTPVGTEIDATGCNADMDGDGILNSEDQCPTTPVGVAIDAKGCEIKDADNDGVVDANDSCPNTAPGASVNERGCDISLDADNDGVLDSVDSCLDTPATDKVDATGCSVFESREVSVTLDILFDNNSSVITNPNSLDIEEFVEFMKSYSNTIAVIEGHSSAVGDADYNQMLSEKRAEALRTLLINEYGIDASRIEAAGFGETQLKDTSDTPEAHAINRRIEVRVTALIEEKVAR